jgi:hypothetical protein
MFNFDPKIIDWDDYLYRIHIPGVLKYVCKWSRLVLLLVHLVHIWRKKHIWNSVHTWRHTKLCFFSAVINYKRCYKLNRLLR